MTTDNVVRFDQDKRHKQIANSKAVKDALDKFENLLNKYGCRWVSISGYNNDNVLYQIYSHDTGDGSPGMTFHVTTEEERHPRNIKTMSAAKGAKE